MKKLEIYVRSSKMEDLKKELHDINVNFLIFSDVKAYGKNHDKHYRGQAYVDDVVKKVKLEVVISDDMLEKTIETVMRVARTGDIGDGKIVVQSVERVYRIRTGETDVNAL